MTTPHTHSEACLVIHASESAEGRQVVNRSLTPAMLVTLKQQLLERMERRFAEVIGLERRMRPST